MNFKQIKFQISNIISIPKKINNLKVLHFTKGKVKGAEINFGF